MCNVKKMHPNVHKHLCMFEETHIYLLSKQKVQLYLRYIDDIFSIWAGTKTNYNNLYKKSVNCTPPFIKFYFNYSKTQIHFLDIVIENIYRKTFNNI